MNHDNDDNSNNILCIYMCIYDVYMCITITITITGINIMCIYIYIYILVASSPGSRREAPP